MAAESSSRISFNLATASRLLSRGDLGSFNTCMASKISFIFCNIVSNSHTYKLRTGISTFFVTGPMDLLTEDEGELGLGEGNMLRLSRSGVGVLLGD